MSSKRFPEVACSKGIAVTGGRADSWDVREVCSVFDPPHPGDCGLGAVLVDHKLMRSKGVDFHAKLSELRLRVVVAVQRYDHPLARESQLHRHYRVDSATVTIDCTMLPRAVVSMIYQGGSKRPSHHTKIAVATVAVLSRSHSPARQARTFFFLSAVFMGARLEEGGGCSALRLRVTE